MKGLNEYVPLEYIHPASVDRELLCRCEEMVFFEANSEIWSIKECLGVMRLPAGISATIYKGYYFVS